MTETTKSLTIDAPEGVPYIDFTREFDAPLETVYRVYTEPEYVKQWMGPNGYEMDVETYESKTGGRYRYIHRDPQGEEYAFNGVFHVVRPNEFIIQTFEFEGFPDVVSIETLRFEDLGNGRTRIHGHASYPSQEARDGMAQSGMEIGMSEGFERLDTILASL